MHFAQFVAHKTVAAVKHSAKSMFSSRPSLHFLVSEKKKKHAEHQHFLCHSCKNNMSTMSSNKQCHGNICDAWHPTNAQEKRELGSSTG